MGSIEASDKDPISLAGLPATPRQRRIVLVIAAFLLAAFGVAAPFGGMKLPQFVSFNPTVEGMVFVNDFVTAILLFSQYSISRSVAMLALATGYLYTALIVVPYLLAYPGAFTGLLDIGPQSSAWLYYFWIVGTPLGAIPYALLSTSDRGSGQQSVRPAIAWSVSLVIALVCGITWITTTGSWLLPTLVEGTRYTYLVIYVFTPLSILVTVIALALLWFRRRSVLDYWLMLVMLSLLLNHMIADFFGGERYSLGFYASRGFTLFTSMLVLALLLGESVTLYARLARSNMLLERERDNKLMNLQAAMVSISHELKQPLTALALNAATARDLFRAERFDLQELGSILEDVTTDSHRMSQVLDNLRGLFGRADLRPEPIDVNEIASGVLYALRHELKDYRIATHIQLRSPLPLITGHRGQLHEVILNLIVNSIEAMGSIEVDRRMLKVTTAVEGGHAIVVKIEDSGPGIVPEKMESIFDAFVTTKANGTGLGLAICRMIVEQHGGQLTASSDGRSGALFQFTLPKKAAKQA